VQRIGATRYTRDNYGNFTAAPWRACASTAWKNLSSVAIRLAYQFDPQLAVSISQADPLPPQIEAIFYYFLTSPHIHFLIADNPGGGKTIMAGLILKDLQYRGWCNAP
jgi:hypothetical protein